MNCDICKCETNELAKLNDTILDRFRKFGYSIDKKLYGNTIKVCRKCFLKV